MWPQTQVPPPFTEGSPFRCPFPLIPLSLPFLWSSPSANNHALESPMKKRMIPSRYFCIYLFLSSQESPSKELHILAPSPLAFAPTTFVPSTPPFRRSATVTPSGHSTQRPLCTPLPGAAPPLFVCFLFLPHYLFISIITQSITVLFIIQLLTAFFFY